MMEYANYTDYCNYPPNTQQTTPTGANPIAPQFDGITEADLDFLKRMNMNDREVGVVTGDDIVLTICGRIARGRQYRNQRRRSYYDDKRDRCCDY